LKSKQSRVLIGFVIAVVLIRLVIAVAGYYVWWVLWSGDNFQPHTPNAANREALVRLYSRIPVGAGHEAVLQEYGRTELGICDSMLTVLRTGWSRCPQNLAPATGR
jgi:hypothetical protein